MEKDKINQWREEEYSWGILYRLKQEYLLEYLSKGYWFIGATGFDKRGLPYDKKIKDTEKDKDFYIKYWKFKIGHGSHLPKKQRKSLEYNFVIEGKIKGRIGNTKGIILQSGDFIVIRPGNCINLQEEILEDTQGITIKIPGIQDDEDKESCKI